MTCIFCHLSPNRLVYENDLVVAIRDAYPVSPGHTLVITKRHINDWFDASPWEQQAIWQAVAAIKADLDAQHPRPDGYNVGFNAGAAAGQTVMHLHVHVIPRFVGDTDDPRRGVRGVIPSKQSYDANSPPAPAPRPTDPTDPFAALPAMTTGQDDYLLPPLRAALRAADDIALLSAFLQKSGLDHVADELVDAVQRGARVRVLTGDYMNFTDPAALRRLYTLGQAHERLSTRLYQTAATESFHPKAYIFTRGPHGAAFVGSSNLSDSALTSGVEWNLKTTHADHATFHKLQHRFTALYNAAAELTPALLDDYASRTPVRRGPEVAAPIPTPRELQKQVLAKLRDARADGQRRGLVVMATGLGKTYLSAFDFAQQGGKRALFVAHREEILSQAADAWGLVHPDRTIGFLHGKEKSADADIVFASVQTLSRQRHLHRFAADHFDYIVIDEFHHAAAVSYRRLLTRFEPAYLIGLTATPDRLDGAALLELCDDNLVARIGLVEGIARKDLVPFRYFGVKDELDFAIIPWRSGRFDIAALTRAAATSDRAAQALREYRQRGPSIRRSLIFCCSQAHADFIAMYFTDHGVPAASVHSGSTSAPRALSLDQLRDGTLEAVVAVDVFNEGVDLPDVNTILMLRPTESPVIFLQQLGRGLRQGKTLEKPFLTVIDFIGNHRSFLVKPQALVALTGQSAPPGLALKLLRERRLDLPPGCTVDISTEALDMLGTVAKLSKKDLLLHTYMDLRDNFGRRPTAREVYEAGANLAAVKREFGTWFHFVDEQGDLGDEEREVLQTHQPWFADLTKTRMSHSDAMVVLAVLDDLDLLHDEVDTEVLAKRCRRFMSRDPLLRTELSEAADLSDAKFASRWRQNALRRFHEAKGFSRQWFTLEQNSFRSRLDVTAPQRDMFDAMTQELVSFRLATHIDKRIRYASNVLPFAAPIDITVSHARANPILRFDRGRRPDLPEGETEVWLGNARYAFQFGDGAVKIATERPGGPNVLPSLMRRWFGATAGHPGTHHHVELVRTGDRWRLRRRATHDAPAPVIPLGQLPYYSELAVACGVAVDQYEGHDVSEPITVKSDRSLDDKRHFVVRATGDSMNGGALPIRDGDLVLCEWLDVTALEQVAGKPVLLTGGSGSQVLSMLKMPVQVGGRWRLRSANPSFADQDVDRGTTLRVVARALEVVDERTGPVLWGQYDRDAIAPLFGRVNGPNWRSGHVDVDVNGAPQSILMVNLRKPPGTPLEHRYADQLLSPSELQWESQASTSPEGAKGRRILHHASEGRTIHLFVRYHTKTAAGRGEPFVYCGTLATLRHEGSKPVRVWFRLNTPLPEALYQVWSR